MLKITQLQLTNFRGFESLTLDLSKAQTTVLVGENGAGKSSVLDALAITSVHLTSYFGSPDLTGRLRDTDVRFGNKTTETKITTHYETSSQMGKYPFRIPVSSFDPEPPLTSKIKGLSFEMSLFAYYTTNRTVLDTPLEVPNEHRFSSVDAFDGALNRLKTDFRSFFQWFRLREDLENETRVNDSSFRDTQLEAVRQALLSMLPNYQNLRVQRNPLGLLVTKGETRLLINQLSDGEKCLIAMVGDIARRLAIANPQLEKPLEGYGVVLIDEIELHLHPKWQREVVGKLEKAFPNCQFIVTTHSPQVISEVCKEGVYLLKQDGTVVQPSSSCGRDTNSILETVMGTSERPEEYKQLLSDIYRAIEDKDLQQAQALRERIINEITRDEPELGRINFFMHRLESKAK